MSTGERALRAALTPLARRDLRVKVLVGAACGGIVGCVVAGLAAAPGWVVAGACLGALLGWMRRSAASDLARRVDAAWSTGDAVACAWDHRDAETGMAQAQRLRALRLVASAPPARIVPRPHLAWAASVPLMLATWLWTSGGPGRADLGPAATGAPAVAGARGSDSKASPGQTQPPAFEPGDAPQAEAAGSAPPTGALRVGASAPGEAAPDAGAPGDKALSDLPSMARAGIGQQAAELAGERAVALERMPASAAVEKGEMLAIALGAGAGQSEASDRRATGDGPRALTAGDDAWAPPERLHPPRFRAVVARYFAGSPPSATQGGSDDKRGE